MHVRPGAPPPLPGPGAAARLSRVSRTVVVAVDDGVLLLDVAGPLQVLHEAGGYRLRLASVTGGPVRTDVGLPLPVELALADIEEDLDTLMVPGYPAAEFAADHSALVAGVRRLAPVARRVVSICSGALLLARAGLLDGRRATTHWEACAALAEHFPQTTVVPDAMYVRDGAVVTSAGASAGIDLALALVGEDLGEERARAVARQLVVFLQRPGGQVQFRPPADDAPRHPLLRRASALVRDDPAADHRAASLARALSVSERHLGRLFRQELGVTPARFVEQIRVETAQQRLDGADEALPAVARRCGFGSAETMRRAFLRVLGIPPSAYRHRFRLPA